MVRVWRMVILVLNLTKALTGSNLHQETDIKWKNEKSDVPRNLEMSNFRSHSFDMPE